MNPGGACQTGGMRDDLLHPLQAFAFILSVSAARILETSPFGLEVANG